MKYLFHMSLAAVALGVLVVPLAAFAEVVPLAPLPSNFGQDTDSLGGYLNTIFYTVIAGAAILAVLRIMWGGFQYMTSEAVAQTKDARIIITMAVLGLILLLASWLILYVINPSLTRLDALELGFTPLENVDGQIDINLEEGRVFTQEEIQTAVADESFRTVSSVVRGEQLQSVVDTTDVSEKTQRDLRTACQARGSDYSASTQIARTCINSNGEEYGKLKIDENIFNQYNRCNLGDELVEKRTYFVCSKDL